MVASSRWTAWLRRDRNPGPTAGRPATPQARLEELLSSVRAGFPLAPAAHPAGHRCSCDRVGCPAPARHPVSFAWQSQATTDTEQLNRWLSRDPQANFISATGRAHDVLDVPAEAGRLALERLAELGVEVPVAAVGEDRYLFFTATRGTPEDEDEFWSSELDSHPDSPTEHPGLRWHCRGSYTLLPPAALPDGTEVRWVRGPEHPLPDPLRVLDVLTDACTEVGAVAEEQWLIG
ncbi:bifunctional DNA primase/polymerase [Kitasatospora acidiphila]|uniref:Bifunctional DNA primase/polymerase n=1 Tax=Kitasatospora acidiphila TaxID=2567942 RepID=A0A540W9J6_9ACTN|nr:bifunctional DNA primase/polymerase [Kitasatospora acidiphila]TQF05690.1 bifunctional DNA primase/polymerase [Kitasatospora acidiphila]